MQVIGWSMWFAEFLFLERNWEKDEAALKVNKSKQIILLI
jgi:lysophosphatidic acid acyltransferase/lysophosphatidylinositol acyltransferase